MTATHPASSSATRRSPRTATGDHDVPFCRTEITPEAQQAALRVLASGWVTMGAESIAFEHEFAAWLGARYAVAVSSCTAAIELALMALGLPPGAPVLTPTLTFCGAVQAIVHAGLRPVLVDADERTLTVSPDGTAKAAGHGAAAMVIQHMAGYPVDGAGLAAAAGIPAENVVEDAAHGLGATIAGRPVGSGSRAACFSFYATKNLPIGEGGAITTTDERPGRARLRADAAARNERGCLAALPPVRQLAVHGRGRWPEGELHRPAGGHRPGTAAPPGPLAAAAVAIAARYDALLGGIPGLELPAAPRRRPARLAPLYRAHPPPEFGMHRDVVSERWPRPESGPRSTSSRSITSRTSAGCSARMSAATSRSPTGSSRSCCRCPLHPGLTDADQERVCEVLAGLAAGSDRPARRASRPRLRPKGTTWR